MNSFNDCDCVVVDEEFIGIRFIGGYDEGYYAHLIDWVVKFIVYKANNELIVKIPIRLDFIDVK